MLKDRIIIGVHDKKLQLKVLDGKDEPLLKNGDFCKTTSATDVCAGKYTICAGSAKFVLTITPGLRVLAALLSQYKLAKNRNFRKNSVLLRGPLKLQYFCFFFRVKKKNIDAMIQ